MAIPAKSPIDMGSQKITSIADPTSSQDAATKNYVLARTLADFADGFASAIPTPLMYFKLDENTGSTCADATGNGHTATFNTPGWATGKINYAANFTGSNYASIAGTPPALTNLSISCWLKTSTNGKIYYASQGDNSLIYLEVGASTAGGTAHKFVAYFRSDSGAVLVANGATTIDNGNWYHLVAVRNVTAQYVYLYVNGALDSSTAYTDTDTITLPNWGSCGVGGTYGCVAVLDEFGLWDSALSLTQIQELYNSGWGYQLYAPTTRYAVAAVDGNHRALVDLLQLQINGNNLPIYANNAAAISGGLVAGQLYRTNANPDTVCVVH